MNDKTKPTAKNNLSALAPNDPRVVKEVLRRLREMCMSELDAMLSRHEKASAKS
jgi:hypothetical protein